MAACSHHLHQTPHVSVLQRGLTPVMSVLRSRDHAPTELCPKPGTEYTGGLVLVDLTLRDLMTCECPKGLWQGPMCDFSEAWSPWGLTQLNWSLSLCRAWRAAQHPPVLHSHQGLCRLSLWGPGGSPAFLSLMLLHISRDILCSRSPSNWGIFKVLPYKCRRVSLKKKKVKLWFKK